MFAAPKAKSQIKDAASLANKRMPPRSMLSARRPGHGAAEQAHTLKRSIGNQATLRLLAQRATPLPSAVQPKLAIGAVDDPLEHEADRVADHVMRMPDPNAHGFTQGTNAVQRKCAACTDEESVARKAADPAVIPDGGMASMSVDEALASPGRPLDATTREFFEPRFGQNFSRVRVHTDDRSSGSARSIGALAYTVGSDIVFASGRYAPGTDSGRSLLAHELTHVMQQSQGARTNVAHESPKVAAPALTIQRQPAEAQKAPEAKSDFFQCVEDSLHRQGVVAVISRLVWISCGLIGVAGGIVGTLVEPGGGTLTGWGMAVVVCVALATGIEIGKMTAAMLECAGGNKAATPAPPTPAPPK
jgi:hypothetical protein